MKVKELIEMLQQQNPEAEVYTHPYAYSPEIFKLGDVNNGYTNNNDWMVTHSEWAYVDEMYSGNGALGIAADGGIMTNKERLKIYESFFHQINVYCITMNSDKIREAVGLIDRWSYAHRAGNGALSDRQVKKNVEGVIRDMARFV